MKVSKRDIYLSIILIGLIIVLVSYFFGVSKLEEKTAKLESENRQLRTELQVLEEIQFNQKKYVEQNQQMRDAAAIFTQLFPARVLEEDQIMYASRMEDILGCYFSYVSTPATEYLNIEMGSRENRLAGMSDITGAIAAHSVPNPANMLDASTMLLGCATSENVFGCTYDQFKDMIMYITRDPELKSVNNVTVSYDSTTGNLNGTIVINHYSMTGTGVGYEPPRTNVTGWGVDCIFGSLAEEPEIDLSEMSEETVTE